MADVGDIYPGTQERIVGKVYNPNGSGYWLQGEFGGVFAEGGAPFLGSYFDPNMAEHRNDPNRRFSGIELTTTGYRSLTAGGGGTGYAFDAPAAPGGGGGGDGGDGVAGSSTPVDPAKSPLAISAKAELISALTSYGLPASLADRLWNDEYLVKGTPAQTIIDIVLPDTSEFKTRFPGLTALRERRNRGEAVLVPSVGEYVQLEVGIASVLRDAGLPPGFYDDPSDFATFIGGSTSPKEVQDRISAARAMAFDTPVETRMELNRIYGIEEGDLVAYWLDPNRALPELEKKARAAAVGGATRRTGYGLLTQEEMEGLAGSGITGEQASARSAWLVPQAGLFAETAGETMTGDQLGRTEEIGYLAGEATAAASIEQRRTRREAAFQGGGGAAGGGEGRTGLG